MRRGRLSTSFFVSNPWGAHTGLLAPTPFQVMDEILAVTRGKAEVIVDCGIRRGSDVLKGLAFGASLVGLGRPIFVRACRGVAKRGSLI